MIFSQMHNLLVMICGERVKRETERQREGERRERGERENRERRERREREKERERERTERENLKDASGVGIVR